MTDVVRTHDQEIDHSMAETRAKVAVLGTVHTSDIDALKEIVIGLTARVNELEFANRQKRPPREHAQGATGSVFFLQHGH